MLLKLSCWAVPILLCTLFVSAALGRLKPSAVKTEGHPIALSDWVRHVGLHYLGLVDKILDPVLGSEEHAQYNQFLDDEEASLNIDARGADRFFVERVLERLRKLSVDFIYARAFQDDKPDVYETKLNRLASCRAVAEVAVRAGLLQPEDANRCSVTTVP
jgi:hypothetical protein